MGQDEEIKTMIEWGTELKQPDFVEFIEFIRDRHADKKTIVVDTEGSQFEGEIGNIYIFFRKPFPDFDLSIHFVLTEKEKKEKTRRGRFRWDYTYMHMFKKIGENKFHITAEESPEATIWLK